MRLRLLRSLMVTACFFLPALAGAQGRPADQPRTGPDVVAQLRQRMVTSGMSAEQIKARLRAEGYPENLLDAYLPGSAVEAGPPSGTVLRAVQELGIADTLDLVSGADSLKAARLDAAYKADTALLARTQSYIRLDTIRGRVARDSVLRLIIHPDSGFVIFGLDVFRATTSQFQPNTAGPVDANYRFGPGDRIVLILTGDTEQSYSLDVTREGFVVIPQVGMIYVNNMTQAELENVFRSRLGRAYSGISTGATRFSLNVAKLRSNQVFVAGDVQRPGSYTVSSNATALTALYSAGGPTINGSLRRVEIRRGGRTVDVLDVYDYLLRGDASHDVRLQNGDIVFVPVHGPRARVVGEIVRPATYEVKAGEGLAQLVEAAGGFTASAARRRVLVERIVAPGERRTDGADRTTLDISSETLATGLGPPVPILNGDVVRVFPISDRIRNRILVRGNVNTPGPQGITPGMKVADALRAAGGIKPDTYLGEVLITRLLPDSSRVQLRARLADTAGAVLNDFPVLEDDQITVFSITTFRPTRYVAIAGHVNRPGRYPFREGMTVRDLVLLGGGVKEGASLREAVIARLPQDRSNGQTAVDIHVPLDSSYLFERRPGLPYSGPPGQPVAASGAPDVTLEPYDNLLIFRQENFEYQRTVVLSGEVRFPGAYALKNKRERLRDLIERAGGLTDEAHADGIVFVRKGPGSYRINGDAAGSIRDTVQQDSLTRSRATNGRIGIDLASVLKNPKSRDNIILEDGDEITLPRYNPVIRVQGAVNAPANVTFVPGRDIYYYIGAAGGGSRTADEGRAYVTQPSGKLESVRRRVLVSRSIPIPQAGAVVTVPERDPADRRDFTAIVTALGTVVTSLVAILTVVRR